MASMHTQCKNMVTYWKTHKGGLTTLDSMKLLGISSFHRRMFELRESGYMIDGVWEKNENTGTKYKRYYLKYDPTDPEWSPVDLKKLPADEKVGFVGFMKGAFKKWKGEDNG